MTGGAQGSEASSSLAPHLENHVAIKGPHSSPRRSLHQTPHSQTDSSNEAERMANFIDDPFSYTPPSMFLEDGGPHRQAQCQVFRGP
jgi:hypothetical protein